jgi:hypothetical protein
MRLLVAVAVDSAVIGHLLAQSLHSGIDCLLDDVSLLQL